MIATISVCCHTKVKIADSGREARSHIVLSGLGLARVRLDANSWHVLYAGTRNDNEKSIKLGALLSRDKRARMDLLPFAGVRTLLMLSGREGVAGHGTS